MRIYQWYEKVCALKYIPHCFWWQSGLTIHLPHFLSHIADMCMERSMRDKAATPPTIKHQTQVDLDALAARRKQHAAPIERLTIDAGTCKRADR